MLTQDSAVDHFSRVYKKGPALVRAAPQTRNHGPRASARGAENEVLQNFGLLLQGRRLKCYKIAEKCYKIAEKSYKNGPPGQEMPKMKRPRICKGPFFVYAIFQE